MSKAIRNRTFRLLFALAGLATTVLVFVQIQKQIASSGESWRSIQTAPSGYLLMAICLLALSLLIECRRWQGLLEGSGIRASRNLVFQSVLGGITASLLTPNRLGEYPARLVFVRSLGVSKSIGAAISGSLAQFVAMLCCGAVGMGFFAAMRRHPWGYEAFGAAILLAFGGLFFYFRSASWLPLLFRHRRLRRLRLVGRVAARMDRQQLLKALLLSAARYLVFCTQLWLLLRWCSVPVNFPQGWALCLVFFWALALIPTLALAEAGVRGGIGVYLFGTLYGHIPGVVVACLLLWLLNLALPALAGTLFFIRALKQKPSLPVKPTPC